MSTIKDLGIHCINIAKDSRSIIRTDEKEWIVMTSSIQFITVGSCDFITFYHDGLQMNPLKNVKSVSIFGEYITEEGKMNNAGKEFITALGGINGATTKEAA